MRDQQNKSAQKNLFSNSEMAIDMKMSKETKSSFGPCENVETGQPYEKWPP